MLAATRYLSFMKDAGSATCDPYIDIYECMASADQSCAQDELRGLGRVDLIIGVLDHKMLWFFGEEWETIQGSKISVRKVLIINGRLEILICKWLQTKDLYL